MLRRTAIASVIAMVAAMMAGCRFEPRDVEVFKSLDAEYRQLVAEAGGAAPDR